MAKKRKKKRPSLTVNKMSTPIRKIIKRDQRYERFCKEYVIDLNGTRAAIAAGYSKKTANVQASQLLTKANIQARIAELQKERADKAGLTAEKVLGELMKIGFSNVMDYVKPTEDGKDVYFDFSEITRDQMAAVQSVMVDEFVDGKGKDARAIKRIRFKMADKTRSLDLLGKHLKLFTDRVQLEGLEGLAEKIAAGRKRVGRK